jgi:uncharacterized membrane protein
VFCFSACGDDSGDGTGSGAKTGAELGLSCPTDSKVTYADDVKPFMSKYCNSCHGSTVPPAQRQGAPSDHNFDTEQGVIDEAYHVAVEAAAGPKGVNTGMPEGGGPQPTAAERKLLGEWLACHADVGTPDED